MLAVLDAFLATPRPTDPNKILKGRVLVGTALCAIVAMTSFLVLQRIIGVVGFDIEHWYFLSLSVVTLAIVRFTKRMELAANLLLFTILTYFTWGSYVTAGLESFLVPGLLVYPLCSAMLANKGHAIVWTAIGWGVLLWFGIEQPPMQLVITDEARHLMTTLGFMLGAGAIGLLAIIYEASKRAGFSLLKGRRDDAEQLANRITQLLLSINQSLVVILSESRGIATQSKETASEMGVQSDYANEVQ